MRRKSTQSWDDDYIDLPPRKKRTLESEENLTVRKVKEHKRRPQTEEIEAPIEIVETPYDEVSVLSDWYDRNYITVEELLLVNGRRQLLTDLRRLATRKWIRTPLFTLDPDDDPFNPIEIESEIEAEIEAERESLRDVVPAPPAAPVRRLPYEETNADRLLYWLSTKGEGSYQLFRDTCQKLGLITTRRSARSLLRDLLLLGHIEVSVSGGKWEVAPRLWVRCAASNSYYQAGVRVPHLSQSFPIQRDAQSNRRGPARWFSVLHPCTFGEASVVGAYDAEPVAELMTALLPDIEEWLNWVPILPDFSPARHHWQQMNRTRFKDCPNVYYDHDTGRCEAPTGLYRCYPDNQPQAWQAMFFHSETQTWHQGDWYGLRFLHYHFNKMDLASIEYDRSTSQLRIWQDERWPVLYERALVLASGLLPALKDRQLVYEQISPFMVQMLSEKLGLKVEEVSFDE